MSRQPSRTSSSLRRDADDDANQLIHTMRHAGIDTASTITVAWDRRQLLNVCLLLAQRHIEHGRQAPPSPLMGRISREDRITAEDARWSDEAASDAHYRYNRGDIDAETMEGNRVHKRRTRRALMVRRMEERRLTG